MPRSQAPSRRARETRRERSGKRPARPTRSRPPPSRSDRGSCRWRGRPPSAPRPSCCRDGAPRPRVRAEARAAAPARSSRFDTEIASSEMVVLLGVIGEDAAHQVLGDLREDCRRRNRRGQRQRAGDRAEIGEPHPHRHGAAEPRLGAQPAADPVGEMTKRRPEDALGRRLPAERRLRSRRLRAPMRPDFPRIAIPGERGQLLRSRPAEQPFQRARRGRSQLPDREHADLGQARLGGRPDAPHQLDRQIVQELELGQRDRRRAARRAWPPARRSSRGAWCAPRRPRSEAPAPSARGAGSPRRSRPAARRDARSPRRRRRPRRWRSARPAA